MVLGWRTGVERVRTRSNPPRRVVASTNAKAGARRQWATTTTVYAREPEGPFSTRRLGIPPIEGNTEPQGLARKWLWGVTHR